MQTRQPAGSDGSSGPRPGKVCFVVFFFEPVILVIKSVAKFLCTFYSNVLSSGVLIVFFEISQQS